MSIIDRVLAKVLHQANDVELVHFTIMELYKVILRQQEIITNLRRKK